MTTTMALGWSSSLLFLSAASILLLLPVGSWGQGTNQNLVFHNGATFSGKLDISILWYGRFGRSQTDILRQFLHSLNGASTQDLSVARWWNMVEQYQSLASSGNPTSPQIPVRIVKEKRDNTYTVGKTLTQASIKGLVQKLVGGAPPSVALIFTDKKVSIEGTCTSRCSRHGFLESGMAKTLYMVVGNEVNKCPTECGWPFSNPATGLKPILPLQPPNGNAGTDSMVIGLAGALAETVSNPYNTGLFGGVASDPIGIVSACPKVFGSGAFPGYMGKVRLIPGGGGCYNAHGVNDSKFLLPALWNPKTNSCWTII